MLASNPEREASTTPPFLVARDIRKAYGGVQALKGVLLTLEAGEIHGLVGAHFDELVDLLWGAAEPGAVVQVRRSRKIPFRSRQRVKHISWDENFDMKGYRDSTM